MPFLIFCVLFLLSALHAQEETPVDCRLLWFDHRVEPPVLLHSGGEGDEVRLELPGHGALSPSVRCHAREGAIRFQFADSERTIAAGIPGGIDEAILIFLPADEGANPPNQEIFVIDASEDTFPHGGAFVMNFYHRDIRFVIGEHRMQLRAAGSHGVERPDQRNAFNMAPVRIEFQQDEDWRTASESQVRFVPGMRYLIFAYVDPESGRPRILTLTIVKPAAAPEDE